MLCGGIEIFHDEGWERHVRRTSSELSTLTRTHLMFKSTSPGAISTPNTYNYGEVRSSKNVTKSQTSPHAYGKFASAIALAITCANRPDISLSFLTFSIPFRMLLMPTPTESLLVTSFSSAIAASG